MRYVHQLHHIPNPMVSPPLEFNPVTGQAPYTQNSPKLFGKSSAVGAGTVTSMPSKLRQKSMPKFLGCSVGLTLSRRLWLFGTDSHPSGPTRSKPVHCCVGGLRPGPSLMGRTVLLLERIWILLGESSSVAVMKVGSPEGRNSSTVPESDILSPTEMESTVLVDSVKTNSPLETRGSPEGSPWMKNPLPDY